MKDFKGTPGKWDFAGDAVDTTEVIDIFCGSKTIAGLAAYEFRHCSIEETNANAKLIAAAPELLEALILARAVILSKRDMDGLSPKGSEILNKINSAINKALS